MTNDANPLPVLFGIFIAIVLVIRGPELGRIELQDFVAHQVLAAPHNSNQPVTTPDWRALFQQRFWQILERLYVALGNLSGRPGDAITTPTSQTEEGA